MPGQVIQLTPPGAAAIAVVRLVGDSVSPFLATHFSRSAKVGRAVHGELRDGEQLIDDPVVVLSPDGKSVDINLHGGPWIVEATLRLAERNGFTRVPSGSPLPSHLMDGVDEIESEILSALPLATTELAVRALLAQLQNWVILQSQIDQMDRAELLAILEDRALHHLLYPPTIAIVGVPNAGKSTLANRLFAQERSITADLPGTTRDWVGEIANIDGLAVKLVDTPGLRETNDAIERAAIQQSLRVIDTSQLVLVLLDATQPMDQQQPILDRFQNSLVIVNKIDANPAWQDVRALRICAKTESGIDAVRTAIKQAFGVDQLDLSTPRCWTERQWQLLQSRTKAR